MTEQTSVSQGNEGSHNEGITPAVPANAQATAQTTPAIDAATLATFREAIVAANPDAIPELIAGSDFASITASVEGAKAAHARAIAAAQQRGAAQPPQVPAGGTSAPVVNVEHLSPQAKIAHGLAMRARQQSA